MIPSVVARQTRETILDYLRTTFSLSDRGLADALFAFLDTSGGLFRGPYLDVRLPFRKATPQSTIPLDIAPSFQPYLHQVRAFERLSTRDDHRPEPTLVSTGTGSGKTECFLYPVLDHCWRQRGKPGIKAILLYPLNALASDQGRRLAQILWEDPRLKGQVTAGLYVGGKGGHGVADSEHLVDDKQVLRQSPPDILLTNYKMLDFLLVRPDDRELWRHNGPDTLRFLVLDELHSYDGAQGSDVACLIRRLKARLGAGPGTVCPVGTSATLGGQGREESVAALVRFATQVFGDEFPGDSIITEDRCTMVEVLGSDVDEYELPGVESAAELDPKQDGGLDQWVGRQARLWFRDLEREDGVPDAVGIGRRLDCHGFLRQVLRALNGSLRGLDEVDEWLCEHEDGWKSLPPVHRGYLIDSYLGLVSYARREVQSGEPGARREPFLTVQVQLWMRELRHLVQRVGAEPDFAWTSNGPAQGHWLPIAYCRSCGNAGWASYQRESENRLQEDGIEIGRAWLQRQRACRFVALGHGTVPELFGEYLDPERMVVRAAKPEETAGLLAVRVGRDCSDQSPSRFLRRCPDCDADQEDGLSLLGSRAPSLLSVAISHLFQTEYNGDKKLLAFTDSVQDASHRAGFFSARTYRFNLRTAIQSVVQKSDGGVPLSDIPRRLLEELGERPRMTQSLVIATLMPADLAELPEYQEFLESGGAGRHEDLLESLRARVSWEVAMEYGYSARVGRTLERTHCSTAFVEAGALQKAADILSLEINEGELLADKLTVEASQVRHFLAGVVQRLRVQGGIDHPLLSGYLTQGGDWFLLTKKKEPLLSPFGSESRLPRFMTDRAPDGPMVFESLATAANKWTWQRDWAARSLGADRKDSGIPALYRRAMQRLVEHGLVTEHLTAAGNRVWALRRETLVATQDVAVAACPVCRHEETVPAGDASMWEGRTCTRYRCRGTFAGKGQPEDTYYGRRYRSGVVERIFAQEHTGLLEREVRERLEDEFKEPTRPDSPNLFVCTPTLELGIDIGDLSATVLCSVPPTTANFLQRVGRAGRKTGNALCLTMAVERPHDLYFSAEPKAMMQGQVLPPGCFLDAPEMLKRQLVAFSMDAWSRQEEVLRRIPPRTTLVLGTDGSARFPGRFLEFYRARQPELIEGFLQLFREEIGETNRDRLREFSGVANVEAQVSRAFEAIRKERDDFRALQRRTRDRLQKLAADPGAFGDPKTERRELEDSERLLGRLIRELGEKYPLNVLTDAGVLPNYAFPEPGVTLRATLRDAARDAHGKLTYAAKEYMRPASSAIRELAPWNTFYADGHKMVIQEVDLGTRAQPLHAPWRLCAECHHVEPVMPGKEVPPGCPRCSDARWADAGQVRDLVRFQRVRSLQTRAEAAAGDDGDDRDSEWYQVEDVIDVGVEHYHGGRLAESLPFGIELLKELPLRELNFGNQKDVGLGHHHLQVAGREVRQEGFVACVDCGRVRKPGQPAIGHAPWCPGRPEGKKGKQVENLKAVFLYREVRSEAIRVLLPVAELDQQRRVLSFKAALELGFRRRFKGDPRHLQIRVQDEPDGAGEGRRRFLVVFDTVPGGTGYLSELWHKDRFRDVLELALAALEHCACQQRTQPAEGCYQCLYAYQSQRHLKELSSREARAMLQEILRAWPDLTDVPTLSHVSLATRVESELERLFLEALEQHAEKDAALAWTTRVRAGEELWTLRIGERTWEIQAQQDLGAREGTSVACRPDFVFRAADGDPAVLPVAVFCDGLEFHACRTSERGRIHDDVAKRAGLITSGRYRVWSVTWKDVKEFQGDLGRGSVQPLFGELDGRTLGPLWKRCGISLPREVAGRQSVSMLLDYLRKPKADEWRQAAQVAALVWFAELQPLAPDEAVSLETRLEQELRRFAAGPLRIVEKSRDNLSRWHAAGWFAALGRCTATLDDGKQHAIPPSRITLRLFDEHEARGAPDFEASWRTFLQAWNLLQFHPNHAVLTSELIALEGIDEPSRARPVAAVAQAPDPAELAPLSPLAQLAPLLTPELLALVRRLQARGAQVPVVGFELQQEGRTVAEAELAWPDRRVAVVLDHQEDGGPVFVAAGWSLVAPEEEALASALGLASQPRSEANPS